MLDFFAESVEFSFAALEYLCVFTILLFTIYWWSISDLLFDYLLFTGRPVMIYCC